MGNILECGGTLTECNKRSADMGGSGRHGWFQYSSSVCLLGLSAGLEPGLDQQGWVVLSPWVKDKGKAPVPWGQCATVPQGSLLPGLLSSQTLEGPKERGWCLLSQWLLLQQEGLGPREGTSEVEAIQISCLLGG